MESNDEATMIGLYMLAPRSWRDNVVKGVGESAICGCVGQDFAKSVWPIVVKVKAEVSGSELAQHLRDLASAIDQGFFVDVETGAHVTDHGGPAGTRGFVTPLAEEEAVAVAEEEAVGVAENAS